MTAEYRKKQSYYKKRYQRLRKKILAQQKARYQRDPEARRRYHRAWYQKNIKRLRPLQRVKARNAYRANPAHYAKLARNGRRKLRLEFIEAYGSKCACCAEKEKAFLTVEHKRRDGKKHREEIGGTSTQILADLRRRGWPKRDYELLCFNCNRASWELGVCPHRQKGRRER